MSRSLFGRPRVEVERALPDRVPVVCPLCGGEPRPFGVDFQGFGLARCPSCGLQCHHPRPVVEQLVAAVYHDDYHPAAHATVDRLRARSFARQLSGLARYTPTGTRTLLDVGCGAGAFLGFAHEHGWVVSGTDVAVTTGARATGARLWEGSLPNLRFDDVRFRAIRLNHVLEHTTEPLAELRSARSIVADDGILLIGVPNIAGLSFRLKSWQSRLGLKRCRWKHYGALHHLWFFTPATLARLVRAAGFEVAHWETPVSDRARRPAWASAAVRWPLETARVGGTLDLYARPCPVIAP